MTTKRERNLAILLFGLILLGGGACSRTSSTPSQSEANQPVVAKGSQPDPQPGNTKQSEAKKDDSPETPKEKKPHVSETPQARAMRGCQDIAFAIESYMNNPANPQSIPPTALQDLVLPPFGGQSFLRNGEKDFLDPWGKLYQVEESQRRDGTIYYLVFTQDPDRTPITQFGVGPEAVPKP